jgi:LysR family transcriptional regulator (chromosome initiation inhibitor)
MQFDPNHLAALLAVLRRGAFDGAAAELNVTPSAVSQRIKALEERVGASLIHRGPPCTATPQGKRLAQHAQDVALLEQQVAQELSLPSNATTTLRVAVNADSLATWFLPAMQATPDLLFDLVIDDQDHSAKWLQSGEVAAAVTSIAQLPGCDAHPLGTMRYLATASPDYVKRWFPTGVSGDQLAQAPCLTFNHKDQLQKLWIERAFQRHISPPSHMLPSSHAFVQAAKSGLGWGMNPALLIQRQLRRGRLIELLPDAPLDVALYLQVSRVLSPALRPVTDAVKQAAQVLLPLGKL